MSFNCVHNATKKLGAETYDLCVYFDKSATFTIIEDGAIQGARTLDPDEDGSDIAIMPEVHAWLEQELAKGRGEQR